MPGPFSFLTATEILFGRGQAAQAPARIAALGRRVLLVHGANASRSEWLVDALTASDCPVTRFAVPREPDMALIEEGVATAREAVTEVIVALGGGAAMDAGKAIAAMVPATRPLLDHLEVVGRGLPLDHPPLPFLALPTTAGTGAEVTRNAVIGVPEHRRKVSLRDPRMLPRLALVDPALTDGCPRATTLASGLDAITQVIEPFTSTRANAFTDALCRDAIPRGLQALRRLMDGEDAQARDEMAWVSLCGGLALANAGLGAVHGLAGPLGGLSGAAHGAICGALLPHVLVANRRAVIDPALSDRLDVVGQWIGEAFGTGPDIAEAADRLHAWSRAIGLPGLTSLGIGAQDRQAAAEAAGTSSSMKANPAPLSVADLEAVLAAAA
ncbi:iron-containing alcohol dehydrogenase [Rubellimicrobium roseum]|uniref:Iron-containing alcohol dehydrogenase n=1 Tax=Rubellimicrobium roseum TaxID=687525 RepID=A0A5C4N884_9RHOB|nr:iron-containing alcohol dehydrogenase [Rubellimicrobium roseum]TNC65022.1 iron-containing alcohol dehydrogenase [Rubellimicrobium roseum]